MIVGHVQIGGMPVFSELEFSRKAMIIVGFRAGVDGFSESLALIADEKIRYSKIVMRFTSSEAPPVFERLSVPGKPRHQAILLEELA